jgi:hypothetical protein
MLEAGPPYQKLLNGYLNFFGCGNNRQSFAREVANWNAEDLEQALTNVGLPACRAFTRQERLAHPQGTALAGTPPIEIVKIADGDPVPFRDHAAWPLDGVRVLDFTHVLAGPRSARTLAEYGAEVLHISSPWFADTLAQHLGGDAGRYDAYLDLRYGKDMVTMRHLAATADVFASTYRPAVNKRFGLLPDQLAAASERGIVYMSATAYGHSGPWKDRPGFDQNGQVASGFVMAGLARLGLRRGDRIVVWLPNLPEWFVAQFAAARLGLTVIAVNTRYRGSEIAGILRASDARAVVLAQGFLGIDFVSMAEEASHDTRLEHVIDVAAAGRAVSFAGRLAGGPSPSQARPGDIAAVSAPPVPAPLPSWPPTTSTASPPMPATSPSPPAWAREMRCCWPCPPLACSGSAAPWPRWPRGPRSSCSRSSTPP